ncbi:MAG: YceI family protein [Chitinophagaceae bacterium]
MQTRWSIDPSHSEIAFKVRHLMIAQVKGTFKKFDATIYTSEKDFTTADIDVWIDAGSVSTGDEKRDEHLTGKEFFDITNHKQISFKANRIEKAGSDDMHDLWGELTMKGISKNIKLQVQFGGMLNDPWGNERAGFSIRGKINRSDWGLVWNSPIETGGLMVGDEIKISCEIELINTGTKELLMELENITEKAAKL